MNTDAVVVKALKGQIWQYNMHCDCVRDEYYILYVNYYLFLLA